MELNTIGKSIVPEFESSASRCNIHISSDIIKKCSDIFSILLFSIYSRYRSFMFFVELIIMISMSLYGLRRLLLTLEVG